MIYVHWFTLVIYVVVIIMVMVRVLMDNRQPAKTMAWMLVLTFIPMLGIILYFFFGQTTRKERKIWQHSMDQLTKRSMLEFVEQKRLHLPDAYRTLINLFMNQNWALPFKNNETEIYTSGYEFFPSLLMEIGKAEHHIHLDTFIIVDDPLGRIVSDALIDKARQGVEVRVIYDDVGSWKTKNRFFDRMRAEGIEVYPFMPVRFPVFTSKVNYRNHRKICVIDGEVGFIGGMNIAMRYVKGFGKLAWRDTHVKCCCLRTAACLSGRLVLREPVADCRPRLLSCEQSRRERQPRPDCDEQPNKSVAGDRAGICQGACQRQALCLYGNTLFSSYRSHTLCHAYGSPVGCRCKADDTLRDGHEDCRVGLPVVRDGDGQGRRESISV